MGEPLRTDDLPNFDTYPGPESRQTAAGGSTLESAAEQIGDTVGRALRAARELPDRADQLRAELRDRFTVVRGGRGASLGDKASDLKDAAQEKLEQGKERATRLARQARVRASRLADEQPLRIVLGVFIAGVIAGVALRLWRSHE